MNIALLYAKIIKNASIRGNYRLTASNDNLTSLRMK